MNDTPSSLSKSLISALQSPGSAARGLAILYASTLLAGMWAMILPIVPVLVTSFRITPGTAAQAVTALAFGRFVGMPIGGVVLDRLGARASVIAGYESGGS